MKDGFLIKIIPTAGSAVYRLRCTPRQLLALAALLCALVVGAAAIHTAQLRAAEAEVARLQQARLLQARALETMARQTQALQRQNSESQRTIESIERTLGAGRGRTAAGKPIGLRVRPDAAALASRLREIAAASARTRLLAGRLQRLALRVVNVRHLAALARTRTLAMIPSLNPVGGAIASGFGYRTNPWREFHRGVDLAADYGTTVRAAAGGTVVAAGWDAGGYGNKVDIDHGNGYHTWYAHLSHIDVAAGALVVKGQAIARVGSTGESTGPHLHYQMMRDGVPIDPVPYLSGVPPAVLATLPPAGGV